MQTDLIELLQRIDEALERDEPRRALRLILKNWNNLADPAPLREKTALTFATAGKKRQAAEIYDLVARHYANAGYPTRSLAAIKQMQNLNPSSTQLLDHFTTLYSVRSPFLERELALQDFPKPADELQLDVDDDGADDDVFSAAFDRATDAQNTAERPGSLPALPLLSLLPPKALRRLLDVIEYEIYAQTQPLVGPDVDSDALFWAVSSDLKVTDDGDSVRVPAGTLLGLNNFGSRPAAPTHTVVCGPGSEALRLRREDIDELTDEFPDFPNRLATLYRHGLTEGVFDHHPMFDSVADDRLEQLASRLTGLRLQDPTVLVRQDKVSPGLYIILDGTVDVMRHQRGEDITIETLEPGDMVGEIGLINPRPALSTAVTSGPAHVLFYERDRFIEFADNHPSVADVAEQRARDRTNRIKDAL